jgi:hypothetical protein
MNARVGSNSKLNFSLFVGTCQLRAHNGSRKDQGDFTSSVAGQHFGWVGQFEGLHDGSREWQWLHIMHGSFPIGWQKRAMNDVIACLRNS